MGRLKWSTESRQKLEETSEYFTQTGYSIITFTGFTDNLKKIACHKVGLIRDDYDNKIYSSSSLSTTIVEQEKEVETIINDYSSKLENELQYICDHIDYVETKKAFEQLIVDYKAGDISKHNKLLQLNPSPFTAKDDNTGKGDSKKKETLKGKAPQLTKLQQQQQQQKDDEIKTCLAKLDKEACDYRETNLLIAAFAEQKEEFIDKEQRKLLISAHSEIMNVCHDLRLVSLTKKDKEKLCDDNVSLIIKELRSKVESKISNICENSSDLTVRKAFLQHLADFKTGFKLKESTQNDHRHLQVEDRKIMSSKPKMSVKKRKKKSNLRRKRVSGGYGNCTPPNILQDLDDFVHDHSECCFKISDWERLCACAETSIKEEEYP